MRWPCGPGGVTWTLLAWGQDPGCVGPPQGSSGHRDTGERRTPPPIRSLQRQISDGFPEVRVAGRLVTTVLQLVCFRHSHDHVALGAWKAADVSGSQGPRALLEAPPCSQVWGGALDGGHGDRWGMGPQHGDHWPDDREEGGGEPAAGHTVGPGETEGGRRGTCSRCHKPVLRASDGEKPQGWTVPVVSSTGARPALQDGGPAQPK